MSLTTQLADVITKYRDCPAITDQDGKRTMTYGELDALTEKAALKLHHLGIREGMCVAVSMSRKTEYIAAELAALKLGAVVVPLVPNYPQERADYIKKDADVRITIEDDFFEELPEIDAEERIPWQEFPEDTKEFIFYTSGTTGKPKGIIYRDLAVRHAIVRNFEGGYLDVKPFVCTSMGAMTFAVTVVEYYRCFFLGGHVHMLSDEIRADVKKLEEYNEREQITVCWMPPRLLRMYQNRDKNLQLVYVGSDRVSGIYSPEFKILNTYGMTETLCIITNFEIDKYYENTPIGKPLGDVTIRILDENWNEVAPGKEGIIVPTGYFPYEYNNMPEETERIFRKEPDGRISIYTGDIGRMLPDGNVLFINRADWLMKIHGQRVEPGEIECVMKEIPGVTEAVAKAFEQPDGSMMLCGFYTASGPVDKEAIRAALNRKLPHYMIPSVLVELERFPLNANNKISRKLIERPDLSAQQLAYEKPVGPVEEALAHAMEKLLRLPKIGRNDSFLELGGNSLNAVFLADMCELEGMAPQLIMLGKTPARIAELFSSKDRRPELTANAEKHNRYPISLSQHYQYDVCASLGANMNLYDMILYLELEDDTDIKRLKEAIEKTVREFPIYRARVNIREKWMEINPTFSVRELPLSEEGFLSFRQDRLNEKRNFTGDPEDAPLFDAAILTRGEKKYLFLNFCHIIYDGASLKLFMDTVSANEAGAEGPEETFSIFDLALFEQRVRETSFFKKAWAFYDAYYDGLNQGLGLFTEKTYDNPQIRRDLLTGTDKKDMDTFLSRMGVSILTLFQGALELAVRIMTQRTDFAYMNVYDGRISEELVNTQGVLAKAVFVRSSIESDKTVREYLAGIQESYQHLVYYDVVDIPELIEKHPHIRSGICLNFRTVQEPLTLRGKPLKVNEECWQELIDAHRPFTVFDLGIDNAVDGDSRSALVSSSKASPEFIGAFLDTYDRVLRELMEEKPLSEILAGEEQ